MKCNIPEKALDDILFYAEKNGIKKITLFGSRARGDYSERSDIDLAVSGGNALNFYFDIEDYAYTLLRFDVVNIDEGINKELGNEIERDGVVIYEKI